MSTRDDGQEDRWAIEAYGEWDEAADGVRGGTCDRCGRVAPVRLTADPYLVELYSEDAPHPRSMWCHPCFGQRQDDV